MKTQMFSVLDNVSKVFGLPFFQPRVEIAKRAVSDLVNDGVSLASKHPEDFSLYRVGQFDDETGLVVSMEKVDLVCHLTSLKVVKS